MQKFFGNQLSKVLLTLVPYSFTSVESVLTVNAVVMTPVKIEIIINPVRTHIMANRRPGTPTGAMSP